MSQPAEADSPRDPVARAVWIMTHDAISTGELAELRRAHPDEVPGPAFWRVLAMIFERPLALEQQPAWACALQGLAQLRGVARPRAAPLGAALAESGFAETRLVRLLRADGPMLFRELRTAAHFLAQKGTSLDPTDFVRLAVIPAASAEADRLRRNVAQAYYRQTHASETRTPES